MFSKEQNSKGEWVANAPLLNREDTTHIQNLNRWVSTVISDVQRTFTDRIIHTIMDEQMFALVLVRSGGLPRTDEDFEVMEPDDKQAVTAFDKFAKIVKFKQQRALIFYADPFEDKPIDEETTIQEFFQVEFKSKRDLPALMLVNPITEKVEFLQPIEEVTEDTIADKVGELFFSDLFESVLQ
mmetsp:Transcript_14850/g.20092  ORF Transcript_14850/g.20092 Transcript_14850/m.20092 type:complete len:183 (+) Transcript_14850:745-1293(+)